MSLIMVGLPTWCEAAGIRRHAESVDRLLAKSFPGASVLIVNADHRSPDGTAEAFLAAATAAPKLSLLTAEGLRGKGHNFRLLFGAALQRNARVLVTLDADLETIPDDWLPALAAPVLCGEADVVVPVYPRHWYDGNQTNQVVAPLVAAVTEVPIRQPIAGEFAFSPAALAHLMSLPWTARALRFGTDIFSVLRCLSAGLRVVQAPLSGGKIHSWRSDTADEVEREMEDKFEEITGGTLEELARWEGRPTGLRPRFPQPPALGRPGKPYDPSHIVAAAVRAQARSVGDPIFHELLGEVPFPEGGDLLRLGDVEWVRILARSLRCVKAGEPEAGFFPALRSLFYVRMANVLPGLDDAGVEPMVQNLADLLAAEFSRGGGAA